MNKRDLGEHMKMSEAELKKLDMRHEKLMTKLQADYKNFCMRNRLMKPNAGSHELLERFMLLNFSSAALANEMLAEHTQVHLQTLNEALARAFKMLEGLKNGG